MAAHPVWLIWLIILSPWSSWIFRVGAAVHPGPRQHRRPDFGGCLVCRPRLHRPDLGLCPGRAGAGFGVDLSFALRAFPEEAGASGTGLGKGRHRERASGRQGVECHPGLVNGGELPQRPEVSGEAALHPLVRLTVSHRRLKSSLELGRAPVESVSSIPRLDDARRAGARHAFLVCLGDKGGLLGSILELIVAQGSVVSLYPHLLPS